MQGLTGQQVVSHMSQLHEQQWGMLVNWLRHAK